MIYQPAVAIALLILGLLAAIASWALLSFAKFPTKANRALAARSSAAVFGFVAIAASLALLSF